MLYYLRQRAGLKPKASEGYGGWDGPGSNLTGHIAGHYLSAVSYMYAATGDPRFKQRADYMVEQLKEVQDTQGDGYIGALMGDGTGGWHQPVGGRQDAFPATGPRPDPVRRLRSERHVVAVVCASTRFLPACATRIIYTGNRTALDVEIKFAGWVGSIVTNLTEAQDQRMLNTEFGGMNEVLADLYADTGDRQWLALSDKFEHKSFVDPLARHEDILGGKHENTEIPKIIGDVARYLYTGNETDGSAANFFWDAGRVPSQLRHRRGRARRILWPARQVERHRAGPGRRVVPGL